MRRRTVHALFAVTALGCALLAIHHGVRWSQAERLNAAISSAAASRLDDLVDAAPEVRFAHAVALARHGDVQGAIRGYEALSRDERPDIRLAASYNLGNLHLRQALQAGKEDLFLALPSIELAKRHYRDVLRAEPRSWDARYNLERALWLAPERPPRSVELGTRPDTEERVMSTLQGTRADLP